MKFTAKVIEMELELIDLEGLERTFFPKERITTDFADRIIKDQNAYILIQKEIESLEQDRMYESNIRFLNLMYKDFDRDWFKKSFTATEISEIKKWALEGLLGVKNDVES